MCSMKSEKKYWWNYTLFWPNAKHFCKYKGNLKIIKEKISWSVFFTLSISSASSNILLLKTVVLSSRRFIWHPICYVWDFFLTSVIIAICHLCQSMTDDRCQISTSSMTIWVLNEASEHQLFSFYKLNVAGCTRNR